MSLEGKTAEEIAALAELSANLMNDPKTRSGMLRLTKLANPSANIPEIDIPESIASAFKPQLDRLAQLEKQVQEREAEERVRSARRKALEVSGVSRDDIPDIEKLMIEKQIPDHKTAAEFLAMQRKSAEPTPAATANRTFGMPKTPDLKEFNGNMQAWARKNAFDVIDQLRGRRAA
jgi:hypothetical protein